MKAIDCIVLEFGLSAFDNAIKFFFQYQFAIEFDYCSNKKFCHNGMIFHKLGINFQCISCKNKLVLWVDIFSLQMQFYMENNAEYKHTG